MANQKKKKKKKFGTTQLNQVTGWPKDTSSSFFSLNWKDGANRSDVAKSRALVAIGIKQPSFCRLPSIPRDT